MGIIHIGYLGGVQKQWISVTRKRTLTTDTTDILRRLLRLPID
jgi:hypothetical protein